MDWDMLLRAIGVLVGAAGTIYQLTKRDPRWRANLKTDIEILSMLKDDPDNQKIVQQNIDRSIQRRYPLGIEKGERRYKHFNAPILIGGLIFLGGFGYWTFSLLSDGWNWWALLTGLFALSGLVNVINAFEERNL